MITKVRKTILQNPLDEIPTSDKPAARPAKKSGVAIKSTRAPTTSRVVLVSKKKMAVSEGVTGKTKRESRTTRTTLAKPSAVKAAVTTQPHNDVQDKTHDQAQSAEQLMAAELVKPRRAAASISKREEEIIALWSAPVKVLEQPGIAGTHAGVGPIPGQFLTAEDIFQNELSRARVSIEAEVTQTRLSAQKIVTRWSRWSLVAGVVPLPFVDMAAITGVQVKMIYELCKKYEVDFEHKAAIAIASGVAGGAAVQTLAGVVAKQMVRFAPGVGQVFMFAVEPAISYVTTQAIGAAFISHFENDGRMHDFNPEKIKQYIAAQIEKRKQMFQNKIRPRHA